jgi:hypothetical protein
MHLVGAARAVAADLLPRLEQDDGGGDQRDTSVHQTHGISIIATPIISLGFGALDHRRSDSRVQLRRKNAGGRW